MAQGRSLGRRRETSPLTEVHRPRARQAVDVVGAPAYDPGCVKTKQSFAPGVGVQEPGITRYGFRRFDGTHGEYCAPRHQDAENPATARKANDQARALMVEADAVLTQEVALSGTLCLWLALVSHAQAAQRSTGKSLRCHQVRSLHVEGS